MYKLCIIGLGNPDQKYNFTRHNIGKDWLKDISRTYDVNFSKKLKFEAEIGESHSSSILWVIPNNYVNNSGNTVFKIIKSTNLEARNFLILHDDLDLKIGNVRLKESGGHGGHNGLRDIIKKIGSDKFNRIRIGIGHPGSKDEVTNWVLNKFNPEEKKQLEVSYSKFCNVFNQIISLEINAAQKILHTDQ
tara:strand:- start:169 stop:738 length:570 start_codon:yes stop_codon:yes gene_type:complete